MSATRPFRSARRLGTAVVVLLSVNAAVLAVNAVFRILEMGLLRRAARGQLVTLAEALASDDRIEASAITWIVVTIPTGIVWLVWQHRSQSNLRAVGTVGLRFSPGWAVGWWFVPIANLWKPFQTVRELHKASAGADRWSVTPTSALIGWWWAAWLIQGVAGRIAGAWLTDVDSIPSATAASRFALLTVLVTIVAAILAILIVRSIVARQATLVAAGSGVIVPAPPPPGRTSATEAVRRALDCADGRRDRHRPRRAAGAIGADRRREGVLRDQLGLILEHAAKVGEVAADDVPPTAYAIPRVNVFREDTPEPSLPQAEALANAPEREDGRFRVVRIVEADR